MASYFSSTKLISTFVTQHISFLTRRGYTSGSVIGGGSRVLSKKGGEDTIGKSNSWIPDPVTGYYRPEGKGKEVDAAELRELLLNRKTRTN